MNTQKRNPRILVVDDDQENIWPLVELLEDEYEVLCATDGEKALSIANSENRPDIILLDIMLPGMDGYEVCARLKAVETTREIPVIFLTAKTEDWEETKGLEAGAQDYITKPFSLPVVRARIKSLLQLKKEMDRRLLLKTKLEELNRQLEQQVQKKIKELEEARDALRTYEEKYHHLFRSGRQEETLAKRLLVVDDSPENIHILIDNLEDQYEIICAASGQEALKHAFSENRPDLILLDIMMPDMDGYEVCSRLKANADTWDIPVIFVTALGQEANETRGLSLGAVDFVIKPYSIPIVKARIKAALRLKEEMDIRMRLTRKLEDLNRNLEKRVNEKAAELKLVYEDLKVSEKKYRDIYENSLEGIFQTTLEGTFREASPAMARILGYESSEEFISLVTDIEHQLYLNPQDRMEVKRILSEKEEIVNFETRFRKKNGEVIWVALSAKVVRDELSNTLYYQGFMTDITTRRQAQEEIKKYQEHLEELVKERTTELRDSQRILSTLMSNLPGMVYRCHNDRNWTMQFVSEGCDPLVGYKPEDLIDNKTISYNKLICADDREMVWNEIQRALSTKKPYQLQYRICACGGEEKWVWEQGRGVFSESGELLFLEGFITDVSVQKGMEGALRDAKKNAESANQAKSAFLSKMSHELRTPLNAILGYAQILIRRPLGEDAVKGLNTIRQSGEHLLMLINDILNLSKIEAGKMELITASVHFRIFLETLMGIVHSRADAKHLEVVFAMADNLPYGIEADETRLRQVLLNLLDNAVKFTDEGRITFRISRSEADSGGRDVKSTPLVRLRFEVEDTGVGIPSDQLERIFRPFEQVRAVQFSEGTGLGLAISRQLVQLMGGDLYVKSQPGQGSLFWFEIVAPVTEVMFSVPPEPVERVISGYEGRRRRILVVDDVASNRSSMSDLLRSVDFEVDEASNGVEALEQAARQHPDVILMDRYMPTMNGLEAALRLRQNPDFRDAVIIAISAGVSDQDRLEIQRAGYNAFLPKPVQWSRLAALLEEHLKLTWKYQVSASAEVQPKNEEIELIPPPIEELRLLDNLAKFGDITEIQKRAIYLEKQDKQYISFAVHLRKLAEAFEEREITALIKQFLNENK